MRRKGDIINLVANVIILVLQWYLSQQVHNNSELIQDVKEDVKQTQMEIQK